MLSLQQQVLQVHDEIKEKHQIALDAISEEAGNSSTGRVRLKEALETEMRARMAAERQIKDLRQIVTQHDERADRERVILGKQLEQVELARASLQARVDKAEQEIRALKQFQHSGALLGGRRLRRTIRIKTRPDLKTMPKPL